MCSRHLMHLKKKFLFINFKSNFSPTFRSNNSNWRFTRLCRSCVSCCSNERKRKRLQSVRLRKHCSAPTIQAIKVQFQSAHPLWAMSVLLEKKSIADARTQKTINMTTSYLLACVLMTIRNWLIRRKTMKASFLCLTRCAATFQNKKEKQLAT